MNGAECLLRFHSAKIMTSIAIIRTAAKAAAGADCAGTAAPCTMSQEARSSARSAAACRVALSPQIPGHVSEGGC
jgi:hypothetical protein